MTFSLDNTYLQWAPILQAIGFWPRPISPGTKAASVKAWQTPDPELGPDEAEYWTYDFADHGVGLVTGSLFPDGTVLGALHVDHPAYVEVATLLTSEPVSACLGADGLTLFVRIKSDQPDQLVMGQFDDARPYRIGTLLPNRSLCLLPPTIDPDTKRPYEWLGSPLHEVNYAALPLIRR